ncbi:MAG: hypothetical protein ACK5PF_11055, partial [bacterium]
MSKRKKCKQSIRNTPNATIHRQNQHQKDGPLEIPSEANLKLAFNSIPMRRSNIIDGAVVVNTKTDIPPQRWKNMAFLSIHNAPSPIDKDLCPIVIVVRPGCN